jgi:hypothetical protein
MSQNLMPILVKPDDVIALKKAAFALGKNYKTIRRWCKEYKLARQASKNAPLEISYPALMMVAHGDIDALEALRSGNRTDPRVTRYFDHLGIPI